VPKTYSQTYQRTINAVSAAQSPLLALEITHEDLAQPIRVVNDVEDLVSNGETFVAMAFRAELPSDLEEGQARARLVVDNVGKEMVGWLEASNGGRGARCRIMQLLRSDPDTIEWEISMDLSNLVVSPLTVSGTLSFEDLLNRPGIPMLYRPEAAPGLF